MVLGKRKMPKCLLAYMVSSGGILVNIREVHSSHGGVYITIEYYNCSILGISTIPRLCKCSPSYATKILLHCCFSWIGFFLVLLPTMK